MTCPSKGKQPSVTKEKIQKGCGKAKMPHTHSGTTIYNPIYLKYLKQIRIKAGCDSQGLERGRRGRCWGMRSVGIRCVATLFWECRKCHWNISFKTGTSGSGSRLDERRNSETWNHGRIPGPTTPAQGFSDPAVPAPGESSSAWAVEWVQDQVGHCLEINSKQNAEGFF